MDLSHDACHCWCHVQSAHIWVCSLPFTLLPLNSVRSFCSVCPASPIATGLIMASYSTWCQRWHASRDKSFQAFPLLFVLQATKAGCGGLRTRLEVFSWRNCLISFMNITSLTYHKLELLICLHFPIPATGINCREGVSLAVARAL